MCENSEIGEPEFFTVDQQTANQRIDCILAEKYSEIRSRSYFQYLIANDYVLINGNKIKKQHKPKEGDIVEVTFVLTPELNLTPENIPLDVIYEDPYLLAINKPPGMVVHPASGHWSGTFVNAFLYHCRNSSMDLSSENARPGIVHRLDKDTSGILLAAKDQLTQQKLSEIFSLRKIQKEYFAVCCGNPGTGEIRVPIGRHPYERKLMCVRTEGGRDAETHYTTLACDGKISLVKIKLITGRTHQIRVHMKHLGTPVLGDALYGNLQNNKKYKASRQLLHAGILSFCHPITQENIKLTAPFPDDIKKYFTMFELDDIPM